MRKVRRRSSPAITVRPPWEWRYLDPHGAPRVLLSNYKSLERMHFQFQVLAYYDPLLRLFQFRARTLNVLRLKDRPDLFVFPRLDWESIEQRCLWIELVEDWTDTVYRIDVADASRQGFYVQHHDEELWAVPEHYFTKETDETVFEAQLVPPLKG